MIIGLVGFGEVSYNLTRIIKSKEHIFATSTENRSQKTVELIKDSGIEIFETFKELASASDILISANSPKSALEVAEKYGKYCSGIYLDLNNISPQTTFKINEYVDNLVDGAIIGKIDSENPVLYLAGEMADDLMFLNEYLQTVKISGSVGDAALLKLMRSSYTKTLSVLLTETLILARSHNLEKELFDVLTLTEGEDFRQKSISRITNTLNNSKRKTEEMEEIISYFSDDDLTMVKAAMDKLKRF